MLERDGPVKTKQREPPSARAEETWNAIEEYGEYLAYMADEYPLTTPASFEMFMEVNR